MEQPDFGEYEKRRASEHEQMCRITASLCHINSGFCRLRVCRRRSACSGAMVPSPHQAWTVRAQREIGLSGRACADLPLCIAHREPEYYELFKRTLDEFRTMVEDHPEGDWLSIFARQMAKTRPPQNRS